MCQSYLELETLLLKPPRLLHLRIALTAVPLPLQVTVLRINSLLSQFQIQLAPLRLMVKHTDLPAQQGELLTKW